MYTDDRIQRARHAVGERIRHLRSQQQLSQYRFSAMIGMDRTYLIGVEKGRRNVSLDNLVRIAEGLDVPLTDLFVDVEYSGH